MFDFPDFHKIGVAEFGNHENRCHHLDCTETYDGLDPTVWDQSSNVEAAGRLKGKLPLVHGGLDDNVSPHQTLRLVDRIIAHDKDFDLLIIPGAEHAYLGFEHYVARRRWDYLVRGLMGIEPPEGRLTPAPTGTEMIAEFMMT
ncbi:Prolyl oligopeptidase family protein [Streptoalloteichus hindustanus]|uniref:Prolyl oligopeptidase family protein n=2 Tax=Streptoalloteichus hindustanus TaxID=2017 RepID=A0A1M4YZ95_STRHI|nr:Prolyl oligopeptidase family protein [Streptoalloteichus hindustanus]